MKFDFKDNKENDSERTNRNSNIKYPDLNTKPIGDHSAQLAGIVNPNDKINTPEEIEGRIIYKAKRTLTSASGSKNSNETERGKFKIVQSASNSLTNNSNPFNVEGQILNKREDCTGCNNPFCPCKRKQEANQSNNRDIKNQFKGENEESKICKNPFLKNDESPFKKSDNHKSASKHENESKASCWTANPFTKVKDHKKEGNKEEYTNSHKKWFPNPFAPPKIKSEEEKLEYVSSDDEDNKEYKSSPTSKRFKLKNDASNKLFSNELEEFTYDEVKIEKGIVCYSQKKHHYLIIVRDPVGRVLFTGYIKKLCKIKDSKDIIPNENNEKPKNSLNPKKAQVSVTLITRKDEKYEKCKCIATFSATDTKNEFVKKINNVIEILNEQSPLKTESK